MYAIRSYYGKKWQNWMKPAIPSVTNCAIIRELMKINFSFTNNNNDDNNNRQPTVGRSFAG